MDKIQKSNEEWKKKLDAHTYHVTREGGTEAAFTGKYWDNHEKGMYKCSNCGLELFSSDTKFNSGTGWPSFTEPANKENIELKEDTSHGMPARRSLSAGGSRVEVICKRCGAHLGHVFDDLPAEIKKAGGPHCKKFCINSASLNLETKK
ncbi:MAG: peptide-methionine (R)-S-oxide reductase MsrB [Candidatus Liptonbacteria bacterium]|nr:peptide-methionine (R)-S-oxide reductase MsrB [Candidatus Liptonbacteria bacterium]